MHHRQWVMVCVAACVVGAQRGQLCQGEVISHDDFGTLTCEGVVIHINGSRGGGKVIGHGVLLVCSEKRGNTTTGEVFPCGMDCLTPQAV